MLVVSNLYPPYYIGGYELGCRDVVEALQKRGHEIRVLTSTYGVERAQVDGPIYRWLKSDLDGLPTSRIGLTLRLLENEVINRRALRRLARLFRPDVVYFWNLRGVSVSLAFCAQRMGLRPCYFVSDNWLSEWELDSWFALCTRKSDRLSINLAKMSLRALLAPLGLTFPNRLDLQSVQYVSNYVKRVALEAGKLATLARVIHWGVDPKRFTYNERTFYPPRRLLYVGQVVPHKGMHTAIEAIRILVKEWGCLSLHLRVFGGSKNDKYVAELRRLVSSYELNENVDFAGPVPRDQLPSIYRQHDILLFPSIWDEPFSITLLEGMSCGLAVVGTRTGGTEEVLKDGHNGLVFPVEDANGCAHQILRLLQDRELYETLRKNARRTIEVGFRFDRMVDSIEQCLLEGTRPANFRRTQL